MASPDSTLARGEIAGERVGGLGRGAFEEVELVDAAVVREGERMRDEG